MSLPSMAELIAPLHSHPPLSKVLAGLLKIAMALFLAALPIPTVWRFAVALDSQVANFASSIAALPSLMEESRWLRAFSSKRVFVWLPGFHRSWDWVNISEDLLRVAALSLPTATAVLKPAIVVDNPSPPELARHLALLVHPGTCIPPEICRIFLKRCSRSRLGC